MLPLLIVSSVALAVVAAATYALIGKPRSARGRKRKQEIINGFRLAGGILLGFSLVTILIGSVGVAFFGAESPRFSKPVGVALAVASLAIITILIPRWAKYFPALIGYGVWNGLRMAVSGHLINNPSVPVERWVALTMIGLTLVTVGVCLRFTTNYRLNWLDRAGLTTWVLGLAVAANAKDYGLAAMGVGCTGLVMAWFYHRYFRAASRRRKILE